MKNSEIRVKLESTITIHDELTVGEIVFNGYEGFGWNKRFRKISNNVFPGYPKGRKWITHHHYWYPTGNKKPIHIYIHDSNTKISRSFIKKTMIKHYNKPKVKASTKTLNRETRNKKKQFIFTWFQNKYLKKEISLKQIW